MKAAGPRRGSPDTVRVFVSSTFKDLAAERDHLIVAVYPELEERLALLDLALSDTDLRWGVPERQDEAKEPENVWAYCRQRIDGSPPIFLSLLGHRYGSIVPDEQLLASERRWSGLSMTELEIRYALRNKRRAGLQTIFFLRETMAPPESAPEFRDLDPSRMDELRADIAARCAPVTYACNWTGTSFSELDRFGHEALELMWAAVLRSREFVPRSRWRRVFAKYPQARRALNGAGVISREHWGALVARQPHLSQLQIERQTQKRFISERLRWYYGGEVERAELAAFVNASGSEAPRLSLVAAPPGSGKTSLLARFSQEHSASEVRIAHFVGAIERSASERDLLTRISEEIAAAGLPGAPSLSDDIKTLRDRLANFLASYRGGRKLVLVIDGLNQLPAENQTTWIPHVMSSQVRLIVSCAIEPGALALIEELRRRGAKTIKVQPLSVQQIERVARAYFEDYGKTLEPSVIERVASLPSAGNPLYLITLLGELREIPGSNPLGDRFALLQRAATDLATSVDLFRHRLRRLEVFGASEVRAWCQALLASRSGFTANQLAAILSEGCGEASSAAAHRIRRALRRVLLMRGLRLDFYHGELRAAIKAEYAIQNPEALHGVLARALTRLSLGGDQYALEQLVHHWAEARDWTAVLSILENQEEILARLSGGDAAYRLCLEFDGAYRAALSQNQQEAAQRIVEAYLSALASERVRERGLSITSANAWLSYGQGNRFIRAVLEAGARFSADEDERKRQLALDCRGILAGLVRREGRLEEAELTLSEITPPLVSEPLDRFLDVLGRLRRRPDANDAKRDGRNSYEMAYVHFLRGELDRARIWFLRSAALARRGRDRVGEAISVCLAANCDFIAQRRPPHVMRRALERANRVFERHARQGDPNADRWTWNVANHLFETAFADNDVQLARRYFAAISSHTWPARYGYSGGKVGGDQMSINVGLLKPHRARLAMLEGKCEDAIALFAECLTESDLSSANKGEAIARIALDYGDALARAGRLDDAMRLWRRALLLPSDQGNAPWQAQIRKRINDVGGPLG